MKFKVYYDEINGQLNPMWVILPVSLEDNIVFYSLQTPFERFYPEDFYDDMKNLSVTQGDLVRNIDDPYSFGINIDQLKRYLTSKGFPPEAIYDADNFIVRFDDLEELLQFDVREVFR